MTCTEGQLNCKRLCDILLLATCSIIQTHLKVLTSSSQRTFLVDQNFGIQSSWHSAVCAAGGIDLPDQIKMETNHSTCYLWSSSLHQQGLQASILCACDSFSIAQDLFACSGQSLLIAERTGAACLYLNLQNPWSIPFVCSMLTVPD